MSDKWLSRASGLSLILGALLFVIPTPYASDVGQNVNQYLAASYLPMRIIQALSQCLLLAGLPGLYAYQARKAGWLGFIGFFLTFAGLALHGVALGLMQALTLPVLASYAVTQALYREGNWMLGQAADMMYFSTMLALYLGILLLGIATVRARVYPRIVGIFLIISTPASFIGISLVLMLQSAPEATQRLLLIPSAILYVLGFVLAGYTLWRIPRDIAAESQPYHQIAQSNT